MNVILKKIGGENIYFFEVVDSTMEIARDFIKENKKGIIVSSRQEKGRGRYGRRWFSPEGGLYFSWIIEEREKHKYYLTELVSYSLLKTIESFGIPGCGIKFPNDIIVNGKKIAGVLLEKLGKYYIIGIGVNVNNEIEKKVEGAVSMKEITGREIEKEEVLEIFIRSVKENEMKFERNLKFYLNKWSEYLIK
ncbi:biotin--[acetyl-CoA-carboxylase] ligase [bacterium]|nr:biotin--[acetyl-CoA-carboxylase] ligase [bacterium]